MSTTFRFSGGSDDMVTVTTETDSGGVTEEFYTYEKSPVMWRAVIRDASGTDDAVSVTALLMDSGNWHLAVGQYSEAWPLPDWPIAIRQSDDCHYSTELVIVAPGSALLTDVWPIDEDAENDE